MKLTIGAILLLFTCNTLFSQITEIGLASFYADKFDGRITASGAVFDQDKLTAAHRTLPFGSKVKVINMENQKEVVVVINDRGPFINDRVIDLSKKAAKKLDFIDSGVTKVKIEVVFLPDQKQKTAVVKPARPTVNKTTQTTRTKSKPVSTNTASSDGLEYYRVKSELFSPKGYGIQVASYKEASNLMKQCHELESELRKDIVVEVGTSNGEKVYRIIVGTFPTREAAAIYHKEIKHKFNGSFVVRF